jgi:hypothetical protein
MTLLPVCHCNLTGAAEKIRVKMSKAMLQCCNVAKGQPRLKSTFYHLALTLWQQNLAFKF